MINFGLFQILFYPAVANDPVLQWVNTRTGDSPCTLDNIADAPCVPIALLSAMSFCSIASVACRNLNMKRKSGKLLNYWLAESNYDYLIENLVIKLVIDCLSSGSMK